MDAVGQAIPKEDTQLSTCYSKHFEKQARKFEPTSILLQGMNESAQLNPNGILHANIKADELADEISRMEALKARTTTNFKNGPCIGSAA